MKVRVSTSPAVCRPPPAGVGAAVGAAARRSRGTGR